MPKILNILLIIVLVSLTLYASDEYTADNFDYSITVETDGSSVLHFVPLPVHVYQNVYTMDLADIAVFNAGGESVPFALMRPRPYMYITPTAEYAHFYPVYGDVKTDEGITNSITELIINIQNAKELPVKLSLEFRNSSGSFNSPMTVYYSTGDLGEWRKLPFDANITRLEKEGLPTVLENEVDTPGLGAEIRYLKLVSSPTVLENIYEIYLHFADIPRYDAESMIIEAKGRQSKEGGVEFEFDGSYPLEQVVFNLQPSYFFPYYDVIYRDSKDENWRTFMRGEVMRQSYNNTSVIPLRDARSKYWKFDTKSPLPDKVEADFYWRPDILVFMEKGEGPYTISYGSMYYNYDKIAAQSVERLAADNEPLKAMITESAKRGGGTKPLHEPAVEVEKSKAPLFVMMIIIAGAVVFLTYSAIKLMKDVNKNK